MNVRRIDFDDIEPEVDVEAGEDADDCDDADYHEKEICCPICGAQWVHACGGEADTGGSCEHLVFLLGEAMDWDRVECHDDIPLKELEADILQAYRAMGDLADMDGETLAEDQTPCQTILFEIARAYTTAQEAFKPKLFDEILDLTEEGICCGPTSYTVLFGLRHSAKKS